MAKDLSLILSFIYIMIITDEKSFSHSVVMKVYGLNISDDRGLTNIDLYRYARELNIDDFRGVFMRDTLPRIAHQEECGIGNFNTCEQTGNHWVCYFKDGMNKRIYFDSFGQVTLDEIQKFLKTKKEYETGKAVIQ